MTEGTSADSTIDWAAVELPDAWPDRLDWSRPGTPWRLARHVLGRARARVELPPGMPGTERISRYVLQEFHNLPNGNYSKHISAGYARWFDRVMLGSMARGRARVAGVLAAAGARRVIDLGCGAGHMAGALKAAGIPNVIGLDPSPYLLQCAARTYPGIDWQQGMAEHTGLADASVDGAAVCFLLHEVPPRYLVQVLAEMQRIVRPGGRVVMLEPSPVQWQQSPWQVWRAHGLAGLYYKLLALRVFEPFADAWHRQPLPALLARHGFRVEQDECGCPFRFLQAVRDDAALACATS